MSDSSKNRPLSLVEAEDELRALMRREIYLMREVLGNMQEEQQALQANDAVSVSHIVQTQQQMIDSVTKVRDERIEKLQHLMQRLGLQPKDSQNLLDKECLEAMFQAAEVESCEILALRDQILALLEKMQAMFLSKGSSSAYSLQPQMQKGRKAPSTTVMNPE